MRCKKHFSDHSSSVGVCASCLRDRLITLIDSQSQIPDPDPNPNPNPNPPPLVFPRSVSPYISRRKSDHPVHRFHSTPQLGPTSTTTSNTHRKKSSKFGLISRLFRSRSGKSQPSDQSTTISTATSTSSFYTSNAKGMSPDHQWTTELESPARSVTRPSPARVKPSPSRSGIAFCLSPLVRASPARHWSSTGSIDVGYSGEIRVSATGKNCNISNKNSSSNCNKPHLSAAASFCANRSRKLADFGRLNPNR